MSTFIASPVSTVANPCAVAVIGSMRVMSASAGVAPAVSRSTARSKSVRRVRRSRHSSRARDRGRPHATVHVSVQHVQISAADSRVRDPTCTCPGGSGSGSVWWMPISRLPRYLAASTG